MRNTIEKYIRNEMENASIGKKAYIYIKVNNLVDYDLIQLLYEAKKTGVEVILNVRGMFSLISEFDKPENAIESFGLIDRYLEHSRIFVFCNGGDEKVYISSADFMTRNLDRRIEVACPIYNKELKKEILTMLDMQRKDNCSSRLLNNALDNTLRGKKADEAEFRSQIEFYEWLRDK